MIQEYPLVDYGLTNALQNVFPAPVLANRAPTTADKKRIGRLWVYQSNNLVYILSSITNNLANWQLLEASGGTGIFAALTVTGLSTLGALTQVGTANINATGAAATNIATGTGALNIGNATGAIAVGGTLNITGSVLATLSLVSQTSTVGAQLIATGDLGNGFVNETSLTSGTNVTQGAGSLTVKSTNGNSGNNTGFIKIYVGTTIAYVPYFTNIAP